MRRIRFFQKTKLSHYILAVFAGFLALAITIAAVIGLSMQQKMQREQVFSAMGTYITDYTESFDVQQTFNTLFDQWLQHMEEEGKESFFSQERLDYIVEANLDYLTEVSIVDDKGIVTHSSNQELIGTYLGDNEQTAPFLCLLNGESSYSADIIPNPFHDGTEIAYFGRTFQDKSGFVLFGINEDNYRKVLGESLEHYTEEMRIGLTGYFMNVSPKMTIDYVTHMKSELQGTAFEDVRLLPESDGAIKNSVAQLYGENCYVAALKTPEYYLVGVYPTAEADQFMLQDNILFVILFLLILGAFFIAFFIILHRIVLREVKETRDSLKRITDGNLNERMNAAGSLEFEELSAGINETVDKLKDLIKTEEDRVRAELLNAKNIQESSVPNIFPPFPENTAFGLYASMNTAEDVGGDFYDFFMTDENTLVIVMADVSGKGMPAALYMMRAKTLIKTYAQQGLPVEEVASETNRKLCEDESAEMFVTAWIGALDLGTGVIRYVHAGHTLPVLIGDEISFVKQKINMVLGGMENARYIRQEVRLSPGDSIFLYTDGITEALDAGGNEYGNDRLIGLIRDRITGLSAEDSNDLCRACCEAVLSDVREFAADTAQYDDITMMWVRYDGNE